MKFGPSLRSTLFCSPLAIIFGVPALTLFLSGEFVSPETAIERHRSHKRLVLHGPAYTNTVIFEKIRAIRQRKPQLLALGTSRVLQFRAGFFLPKVRFYNGGSCIQRIVHFRQLLDSLSRKQQPELLLVGVDQYWFNGLSSYSERKARGQWWFRNQMESHSTPEDILRANWWQVDQDLLAGKIPLQALLSMRGLRDRIGLSALTRNQGQRNDGSYRYPDYYYDLSDPRHPDSNFKRSLALIAKNETPFERGAEIFGPSLSELQLFLQLCHDRGITVIGFLPPFAPTVWNKMKSSGDDYSYLEKLEPALRPIFKAHDFEFYDFSTFSDLGASDAEAIDGFHGSEKVYLRLLAAMLRSGSRLNGFADLSRIQAIIDTKSATHELVSDSF